MGRIKLNLEFVIKLIYLSLRQDIVVKSKGNVYSEKKQSKLVVFKRPRFSFMDRIFALNWKNITGIRRNLSMLIIQFLMPSFQCLLNFTCLGPDPYDIPIAIYNADSPPLLSDLFISNLSNVTFRMSRFDSLSEAVDQVKKGLAWAVVEFQSNYTRGMQYARDGGSIPQVNLHIDSTNYVIFNTIRKEVWLTFNHSMTIAGELFGDGESTEAIQNPISITTVYGNESPTMSEFMAPGKIKNNILFCTKSIIFKVSFQWQSFLLLWLSRRSH